MYDTLNKYIGGLIVQQIIKDLNSKIKKYFLSKGNFVRHNNAHETHTIKHRRSKVPPSPQKTCFIYISGTILVSGGLASLWDFHQDCWIFQQLLPLISPLWGKENARMKMSFLKLCPLSALVLPILGSNMFNIRKKESKIVFSWLYNEKISQI